MAEKIMGNAPGHVSTEPLLGTPGNTFAPPLLGPPPKVVTDSLRLALGHLPPAPSPNLRPASGQVALTSESSASAHETIIQPVSPVRAEAAPMLEWSAQIEQVRNDVFGIAMSVSALKDRLDRLEQKVSSGDQSTQTDLLKLRGEVEVWLENHLNGAVEHCMQRIITRVNSPVSSTTN
jgi:hypothetical protein